MKMKTNEENVTVWGIHCTIDEESDFIIQRKEN